MARKYLKVMVSVITDQLSIMRGGSRRISPSSLYMMNEPEKHI